MILVCVTKKTDGSFDVHRWEQKASIWKIPARKPTLKKTHQANCLEVPSAAMIQLFYSNPPDALRTK